MQFNDERYELLNKNVMRPKQRQKFGVFSNTVWIFIINDTNKSLMMNITGFNIKKHRFTSNTVSVATTRCSEIPGSSVKILITSRTNRTRSSMSVSNALRIAFYHVQNVYSSVYTSYIARSQCNMNIHSNANLMNNQRLSIIII